MSLVLASAMLASTRWRMPHAGTILFRARTLTTTAKENVTTTATSRATKESKDGGVAPRGRATPESMQGWRDRLAKVREQQEKNREMHINKKLK